MSERMDNEISQCEFSGGYGEGSIDNFSKLREVDAYLIPILVIISLHDYRIGWGLIEINADYWRFVGDDQGLGSAVHEVGKID